jgi:ligand-binding sensor domain-containing protein
MDRRVVLGGAIVVLVAMGAYALGRYQQREETGAGTFARAPADAGGQDMSSEQEALPQGHPETAGQRQGAGASSATGYAQHFRVGSANVKALLADGEHIWVGTSDGLIRYTPSQERYRKYDNTSGLLSDGIFSLGKVKGEIWAGTYGGGLSVLDPHTERWRNYNIPNGMADAFVYDVLETRSGDIWIATWSGANRVLDGDMDNVESWLLYTVENTGGGLPNDWVYGLSEGVNGEIWVATEGGVARFAEETWTHWTHADGLGAPYEQVEADMPFRNDPGEVSAHHARQKVEQGLEDIKVAYNPNYIVSLAVDRQGHVWAGTWGAGVSRYDGQSWRTFTVADGLPGNHIFALGEDNEGSIWIGTSRGLARYDTERFVTYGKADGLFTEIIFSIEFAANGATWLGGLGGVTWYPHGIERQHAGG